MQAPAITHHAAYIATLVSIYASLGLAALLLFLVMRRDRKERSLVQSQSAVRDLTRELTRIISGSGEGGTLFASAPIAQKLSAVSHLAQLVRGDNRADLVRFAQTQGVFDQLTLRAGGRSLPRRVEAVRSLGIIGGPIAVTILREVMRSDAAPMLRLEAAAMLARNDALPAPATLIRELDLTTGAVTPIHRALFRSVAKECRQDLVDLLRRRLPAPVRALLVDALGFSEDYSVLKTLALTAGDEDAGVRIATLQSAQKIGHPAAAGWATALLCDPDPEVRAQAIQVCAALRVRGAFASLAELRFDESPLVRFHANQAHAALRPAS